MLSCEQSNRFPSHRERIFGRQLFTLGSRLTVLAAVLLSFPSLGLAFVPHTLLAPQRRSFLSVHGFASGKSPITARPSLFSASASLQPTVHPGFDDDNSQNLKSQFASARRIIAVGDVHGGSKRFLRCLRSAGVADERGDWCGGDTVLVQVGDVLDRGVDEAGCVETLLRLRHQSRKSGGNVVVLLGNHEILNAEQDFRYAASGQFSHWKVAGGIVEKLLDVMKGKRARLFQRGCGPMAMFLSSCPVVVQIGDSVFCHGGLTPATMSHGFQQLNDDTSAWLQGRRDDKPRILEPVDSERHEASPLWQRAYGMMRIANSDLARLDRMLDAVSASKMIIGHTPQPMGVNGVETRAGNQVWRVDVGLAEKRGRIECLELLQAASGVTESLTVLGEGGCDDALYRLRMNRHAPRKQGEMELGPPGLCSV